MPEGDTEEGALSLLDSDFEEVRAVQAEGAAEEAQEASRVERLGYVDNEDPMGDEEILALLGLGGDDDITPAPESTVAEAVEEEDPQASAAVAALAAVGHPYYEQPYGTSIPSFYAMITRRHMHEYGTTREQLAQMAVTTRDHAVRHPNAHMTKPITAEEVINSKPIAEPLNILDCCLISDAGGAYIVTEAERAKDLKSDPVYLLGIGEYHTHEHLMCADSLTEFGAVESGRRAYNMAGLGPADMDFAELYDCFSVVPMIEMEELGLCERGGAGAMVEAGNTRIDGQLPINTHGGMLSHAHAGAAGGLFGIIEAVRQLRGQEGKRQVASHDVALVHNEGGILSSHCTMILGREER